MVDKVSDDSGPLSERDIARGAISQPDSAPSGDNNSAADQRRLAIRRCILTCLSNGWAPPAGSVWKLVALKEAWLRGERQEDTPDEKFLARLRFYKWLYGQGIMGS